MKTPLFFSKPALLVLVLALTSCGNASKKNADADGLASADRVEPNLGPGNPEAVGRGLGILIPCHLHVNFRRNVPR
ncbi:MAG: hypothetical protein ACO387_02935, partial [Flavobacteriaceae bacterium]